MARLKPCPTSLSVTDASHLRPLRRPPALTDSSTLRLTTAITFVCVRSRRSNAGRGSTNPDTVRTAARGGTIGRDPRYATTSRWRRRRRTTEVEPRLLREKSVGHGCGTELDAALFEGPPSEDVHRIVAGVVLPNPASIRARAVGFRPWASFQASPQVQRDWV